MKKKKKAKRNVQSSGAACSRLHRKLTPQDMKELFAGARMACGDDALTAFLDEVFRLGQSGEGLPAIDLSTLPETD